MVLRNSNQSSMGFLYNMEFTMQGMTSSGQTVDLPLVRSRYATWRNQCNTVWKSTSASGAGIATPSSRCRVDGVEDDAMIQHERAVNF